MSGATILIVDDQPDIIDAITGYLAQTTNNYKFLQAVNGEMAYQVAEKRKPDLIIMDWEMPLMNGYQALLAIKANPTIAHIPVIMATGRSSSEDLDKALNAGAADYVRKPIEKQELQARVQTCLNLSMYIKEIKLQNEKLVDLNREKDGLVNIVAHDLRSPLSTIVGFSELIKREAKLGDNENEYLSFIEKAANDGMYLINDLLDVHAFEMKNTKIELDDIELKTFMNEWLIGFEQMAAKKGQNIEFLFEAGDAPFVTDQYMLTRILNNLISNAIKFSEKGKKIFVSVKEYTDVVQFIVKDQGPGISSEDQTKMFKRFQKLSARPTNGESSNGLGLSIIKILTEKLGGDIQLQSVLGEGTQFTVNLPKEPHKILTI